MTARGKQRARSELRPADESNRRPSIVEFARRENVAASNGHVAITLLIVDEESLIRAGARSMLEDSGIDVVGEATSVEEAVAAVRGLRPDVVLLALAMSGVDGIEATGMIKDACAEAAVVIVTREDEPEKVKQAIAAGASGYLERDVSRDVLVESVKLAHSGRALIDSHLLTSLLSEHALQSKDHHLADAALASLSPRELEVVRYLASGCTNKEVAQAMNYSVGTVKNVIQRTIEKLGVTDRTQAAVLAVRAGL